MNTLSKDFDSQNKIQKEKVSVIKIIYNIYHRVAEVFLYALLLILILIAILFVAYFIDMRNNIKNGINKQPLFGAYVIISPSMVPTINVLDAIVIQRKEKDELKVGDIITFVSSDSRYSGLTITHRIIGIEKSKDGKFYFRTKGDNNNTEDAALVNYDDIYGKVILRIPKIGYIQQLLTKSYGWVMLIVVPCILIILYDLIKIFKLLINKTVFKDKDKEIKESNYIEELIDSSEDFSSLNDSDEIEFL